MRKFKIWINLFNDCGRQHFQIVHAVDVAVTADRKHLALLDYVGGVKVVVATVEYDHGVDRIKEL